MFLIRDSLGKPLAFAKRFNSKDPRDQHSRPEFQAFIYLVILSLVATLYIWIRLSAFAFQALKQAVLLANPTNLNGEMTIFLTCRRNLGSSERAVNLPRLRVPSHSGISLDTKGVFSLVNVLLTRRRLSRIYPDRILWSSSLGIFSGVRGYQQLIKLYDCLIVVKKENL